MMRLTATAVLALALAGPAAAQIQAQPPAYPVAVLQTLDKVTGRVRTVDAPIEQNLSFGTLDIMVRACRKRPPEEQPESAAFVEVRDIKPGETPKTLFVGWMFASSPAISALEHPVYDVWVLDCKGGRETQSGAPPAPAAPAAPPAAAPAPPPRTPRR
jgi:hypothetical protein